MASFTANNDHRHAIIPFDAAQDAQAGGSKVIEALVSNVPGLKLFTRTSPRFEALRAVYNTLITSQPLVVCRPTTVEQVQGIVKTVARSGTQIAVRCGGHDVWGRGCVADSVTIDMRELDSQKLAEDKTSITVGGGVTSDNFVAFLDTHGLCTAQGTASTVGWTGWALWGGYGPFNDYVGLGVDNILAAKVVTADGSLVQADDELLWGIRGAGGNLGVIVETQVKVYSMPKILAGFIGYAWEDAEKVLLGLQQLLDQGAPDALCVQMGFMKSEWGLGATLIFIWPDSENLAEGRKWMDKVTSLGTVVVNTTSETTFQQFRSRLPDYDPANVYTRSASFPKFTSATVRQILKQIEAIPDETKQYVAVAHIGHGKGTRPNPASCFGTRQPHVLLHINACEDEPAEMEGGAVPWVDTLVSNLRATGELMKPAYVSFMGEDESTHESFGDNWGRLKQLKKRVDGKDVFGTAQPRLPVA
ncbi:FAD binding domain-containing protein [Apodospora peruviana]|uniref:FAD binding domain-containing protein n=1 Tax=Apodospora peruviana TaxID=516989 RepID=A0AAE0I2J5_9PEZI|nr:FAD binding domain-containing protein [Apodospora peruviana]